jgi:hypothetical protein
MARIRWVEDDEATGELADIYAFFREHSSMGRSVPDIMRTLSVRPDFLKAILEASNLHFSDGFLTRAQHEMIASYVSALNRCHY